MFFDDATLQAETSAKEPTKTRPTLPHHPVQYVPNVHDKVGLANGMFAVVLATGHGQLYVCDGGGQHGLCPMYEASRVLDVDGFRNWATLNDPLDTVGGNMLLLAHLYFAQIIPDDYVEWLSAASESGATNKTIGQNQNMNIERLLM